MKFKNYLTKLFILLIISLVPITSFGKNEKKITELKISIKLENAKLTAIFSKLKNEYDINFSYGQKIIEDPSTYSVNYQNILLTNLLNDLASKGHFKYEVDETTVLVKKTKKLNVQQTTIGTITDRSGLPLIGATIIEKGTLNGTTSDFDGKFSITTSSSNAILIISFIGYQNQEISINGQNNFNITLQEKVADLSEVVITALGMKREKKALGYSVGEINDEKLNLVPQENVLGGLSSKISGLDIRRGGNDLNNETYVYIRGKTSLTGNDQPLVVIDGSPVGDTNVMGGY
ncbi:putative outer membrane protein [Algibacter lectus]|uniref:Putative outer membrane protein n=1 Tax=Algibacter lectus TaxID=221126 RepID=A0A090WSQ7_9FLAO|nr:carboxypeptidase-like regulatory domain-containing protein [Algibacter lectus]GAL80021.1 putative outer membrane protein [Algibacter lectus]